MTLVSNDNHAPARLRRLIAGEAPVVFPTCFDALSARLLEQAGFNCTLMSGFHAITQIVGIGEYNELQQRYGTA